MLCFALTLLCIVTTIIFAIVVGTSFTQLLICSFLAVVLLACKCFYRFFLCVFWSSFQVTRGFRSILPSLEFFSLVRWYSVSHGEVLERGDFNFSSISTSIFSILCIFKVSPLLVIALDVAFVAFAIMVE